MRTSALALFTTLLLACSGSQTGNQTGNQTGTQTGNQTGNQTGTQTGNQTGTQTGTQTGSQTGTQTGNQTGAQAAVPNAQSSARGAHMDGPFYMEDGAPDPRHCTADAECLGDTVTDSGGCCVPSSTPIAQTWAYHTWLSTQRMAECAAASCPMISPSMPEECALTARCVEGVCVNTCP
ncbi:MAG: hypothetical protein K1X94_05140 [Sandaracinaceae bacterium]|nr:hypothetical protein [Sandaracinaceae bacterium]